MRTFYFELNSGPNTTSGFYEVDAPSLDLAMQFMRYYLKGCQDLGLKTEIVSVGASKRKGAKYLRIL